MFGDAAEKLNGEVILKFGLITPRLYSKIKLSNLKQVGNYSS